MSGGAAAGVAAAFGAPLGKCIQQCFFIFLALILVCQLLPSLSVFWLGNRVNR